MTIKIYHNSNIIYLTNKTNILKKIDCSENYIFISVKENTQFGDNYTNEDVKTIIYYHKDFKYLKKQFFTTFKLIKAAGGIVQNEKQELLLIHRRGFWDLPKGKLEKDEKIKDCAIREIEEETGTTKLKIQNFICTTYHTYYDKDKWIIKETFWYFLKTNKQKLKAQQEEGITKVIWVKKNLINKYFSNTYTNIIDVFTIFLKK